MYHKFGMRRGVPSAIFKNRRYWPTVVPGDAINDHFSNKDVDDTESFK